MKLNGTQTQNVTIEIKTSEAAKDIRTQWLKDAIGHHDGCIRDGNWYYSWYAAHPDFGKPDDGIRPATKVEQKIYDGLEQLVWFYRE